MRVQRKYFYWLGGLALLALSLLVWRIWPTPQPYYNGKPLSYWFKHLPQSYFVRVPLFHNTATNIYRNTITNQFDPETQAIAAIQSMGTNSLPFLFSKLVRQRSQAWKLTGKIAINCGIGRLFVSHFPDLKAEKAQAMTGLLALMLLPQGFASQLQTLSTNSDEQIAIPASWLLEINADPRGYNF